MLDDDMNIKLVSSLTRANSCLQIDFGDAKDLNEPEPEAQQVEELNLGDESDIDKMQQDFSKSGGGRRGTLVGTINYLSPEMIKEQRCCLSTDLWAFGVILFKMATGKVPFPGTQ